jgi:hypothetical protein
MKTPKMKTLLTVLVLAVMSLAGGTVMASVATSGPDPLTTNYDLALAVSTGAVFSLSVAKRYVKSPYFQRPANVVGADITVEIWVDMIVEYLRKNNDVLGRAFREDDRVLGGKVVHIPQAGANLGGERSRTTLPATASKRTDTDVTYTLIEYTTNPAILQNTEQAELSYDKMVSLMADQLAWLDENITADLLQIWAAASAAQIVRTTGADSTLNLSVGATGTRKILTVADFKKAMVLMNKNDVPKANRIALLDSDMYGELLDDPILQNRDVAKEADYVNGVVARLFGFDILERSENTVFTNAGTPVKKAVGAATATSDNKSSLFFERMSVAAALGQKEFFESKQDPLYFGDVYSALMRAGGRQRRADGKGIVSIVQTVGA